jgi:hypothetical protein
MIRRSSVTSAVLELGAGVARLPAGAVDDVGHVVVVQAVPQTPGGEGRTVRILREMARPGLQSLVDPLPAARALRVVHGLAIAQAERRRLDRQVTRADALLPAQRARSPLPATFLLDRGNAAGVAVVGRDRRRVVDRDSCRDGILGL